MEVSNFFCELPRNCLHFANSKLFENSDTHLLVTPPGHLGKNRSGKCPTLNHYYLFTFSKGCDKVSNIDRIISLHCRKGLSLLTWLISFSLFFLPLVRVWWIALTFMNPIQVVVLVALGIVKRFYFDECWREWLNKNENFVEGNGWNKNENFVEGNGWIRTRTLLNEMVEVRTRTLLKEMVE